MANMFETLLGQVGTGDELGQIASLLGSDGSMAQKGIAAALPALLGGLAKNAGAEGGAASLLGALDSHDGSILNNLGGLAGALGDGEKILGHVFGNRTPQVAQAVSQKSGLDLSLVMKLLPLLAPIVMGYLGKQKREANLDEGALRTALGDERRGIAEAEPGLGDLLGFLDSDDEEEQGGLLGQLGNVLGGDSSGLGSILGKVLGG